MFCNIAQHPDQSCDHSRPGASLGELARVLNVSIPNTGEVSVIGVSDDSRSVEPGDLYVALPGTNAHGLDFEAQAHGRGAVAVLSDRPGALLPTLVVPDPRLCAGPVSAHVHHHPSATLDVFGVTGTNGKTSTTYLLAAALSAAGENVGAITGISITGPRSTFPSSRTTPEAATLQRSLARFRDEGATSVAMEVSSHAVAQRRVDGTRFAAVGFTNLGHDHLDFHGSMERYFAAKSELFEPERTAAAAIGIDDDYGRRLASTITVPCWTWSTTNPRADIVGDSIECTATGTTFTARTPYGNFDVRLPLLGPHQVDNALAALSIFATNNTDFGIAVDGFARVRTVPGRLERIDEGQRFLAVVDYMHNTAGQRRLLPYLRALTNSKLIVVIGATGDRDPDKRFPLGATAAALADVVIVSDESAYSEDAATIRAAVAAGAVAARSATVFVEPDRRRAFTLAVAQAGKGDVVLVTGRGCDSEQVFHCKTIQFDDRIELRKVLRESLAGD